MNLSYLQINFDSKILNLISGQSQTKLIGENTQVEYQRSLKMVKTKKSRKERNGKDKVISRADPYCFRRSVEPTLPLLSLMLLKFPHLGDTIFQKLDNTALFNCKKVDNLWKEFILGEKFYKDRVLRRIQEVHDELKCNHFNQSTITNTQKIVSIDFC